MAPFPRSSRAGRSSITALRIPARERILITGATVAGVGCFVLAGAVVAGLGATL